MDATVPLPHVFIACAPPDLKYAELIIARARSDQLALRVGMFGEGRTSDSVWQLECRRRIASARAVLVLVSPYTRKSARALWQVRCAREQGIPVVGLVVAPIPQLEVAENCPAEAHAVIGWRWKTIAATLAQLASEPELAAAKPQRQVPTAACLTHARAGSAV